MKPSEPLSPYLIDLPQQIPGWEHFIGAWVIQEDPVIIVDVGPVASIQSLFTCLEQKGITRVDYVWLTHIHIDHAGGLGPFLQKFPMARAVVPAKGRPHLIDPAKLWEGSLATLREKAVAYGPIESSDPARLISNQDFSLEGLTILETPGHAPFHLSFSYRDHLFCGESAGIYIEQEGEIYLRPPTPPRFFFDQTMGSVEKMLELKDQPIFFGHAGSHPSSHEILNLYRSQLFLWREVIGEVMAENPEDFTARAMEVLLEKDPRLAAFHRMNPSARDRERFFMANSIAGFLGYLKDFSK